MTSPVCLHRQLVRLVVDQCRSAEIDESEMRQKSQQQRRWCETQATTPGASHYLNVHTPLQLGGRSDAGYDFPMGVQKRGFHGCVKNFRHNGEVCTLVYMDGTLATCTRCT